MANKEKLSEIRAGTTTNKTSKKQEKEIQEAVLAVRQEIEAEFSDIVSGFEYRSTIKNSEIIAQLNKSYPDEDFSCELEKSYVSPDGGLFGISDSKTGRFLPVLVSEAKKIKE